MFHAVSTEIARYAAVAGRASGITSRRNISHQFAPSMRAASNSSSGIWEMYWRNSSVPKPVCAAIGRISPG